MSLAEIWRPIRQSALLLMLMFSLGLSVSRGDIPFTLGAGFLLVAETVHVTAAEIVAAIREVR